MKSRVCNWPFRMHAKPWHLSANFKAEFSSLSQARKSVFPGFPVRGVPSSGLLGREYVSNQSRRFYHRIADLSPRDMAEIEDRVWSAVGSSVKDPEIDVSLKELGWMTRRLVVSKDGAVLLLLKVPTLLHPSLDKLKEQVKDSAQIEIKNWMSEKGYIEGADDVLVNVEALATIPVPFSSGGEDPKEIESRLGPGLVNVAHYLAVYSCKGGVGKSTVAVNLAYELARMGGRVGLLDLDVYGPSLPVLVKPDDPAVRQSPLGKGMVYPIEHKGVKLLSLGYVSSKSGVPGSGQDGGAAVLRGPMAGKVVTQLLKGTDWGNLDVLILDLPPGTGDVQLTMCQDLDLSGAVGVTTPSKLAITDARKGIEMFSELGVATLAMVENMSYFECEDGRKHFPFGKGFADFIQSVSSAEISGANVCELPISPWTNNANEDGVPLSLLRPEGATSELHSLSNLAQIVSRELIKLPYRPENSSGTVSFEDSDDSFELTSIQLSLDGEVFLLRSFSENGALQKRFNPQELRGRDPKTGTVLEEEQNEHAQPSTSKSSIVEIHRAGAMKDKVSGRDRPQKVEKKAKVGYEVLWGDGAKYIYSRRSIALAAGGKLEQ